MTCWAAEGIEAPSKEQGRVRWALQEVERGHTMFQQLWGMWQSVLPADSSGAQCCKKILSCCCKRVPKEKAFWHGSSYFSAVFPADLSRQWGSRWEWGKVFLAHQVFLFDKVEIFPVSCTGRVSSGRKYHFRSPGVKFPHSPHAPQHHSWHEEEMLIFTKKKKQQKSCSGLRRM